MNMKRQRERKKSGKKNQQTQHLKQQIYLLRYLLGAQDSVVRNYLDGVLADFEKRTVRT